MHVRCPALLGEERGVDRAEAVLVARGHWGEPTPGSAGPQGGRRTGPPQRPRLWGRWRASRKSSCWPRRADTARAWTEPCRRSSARSSSTAPPVYVRKEIVHNKHVVEQLRERGAIFVEEETEVPEGETVVFSAHGVAPSVHANAEIAPAAHDRRHLPARHQGARGGASKFAAEGYTIVLVGHEGHEEVEGTMGEAPGPHRAHREPRRTWTRLEVEDPEPHRLPHPDHALRRRDARHHPPAARALPEHHRSRAPTTSATPPPTARWPSARWRASATWCW